MNYTQSHSLNQPKSQNFWLCTMPIALLGYFFFFDRFSWTPGWPWTVYLAKAKLELLILLSQWWDYRLVPPYPVLRGAGDWTQDSPHAKQALYQQSYNSNPASFNFQMRQKYPLTSYILPFILYLRDLSRFEWWVRQGQGVECESLTEQCPLKLRHFEHSPPG